jgi:hypothetical protein
VILNCDNPNIEGGEPGQEINEKEQPKEENLLKIA